ncbi:lysophospholipid acyltransferase family protein [Aeoliella mucimassa]|uniref:1-acyl-sn-glycerol-3-phosphate acyltransferase n=1 Tax=Aeoliella mucimassa TaxID=2527972 RepID=A0A518ALW4_9BACT|nr:lysophospholipid acyltransferase family protein [Aeoliella mucimassa]QDU55722.1 1-acyl-sn-glycerol-3-phosphate acyltransferase [Aeoliella mucimassa]
MPAERRSYSLLQWFFYFVNMFLVRVMWRAKLPDKLPIPDDQGAMLICNHRSSIDPCVIQVVAKRRLVHWLVAQLYKPGTFIARMLDVFEVISVRKGGNDVSPLRTAIRRASAGELVGMFPEGTINTTDDFMRAIRPGAVVVALRAKVPVLPCYLDGSPYHRIPWMPVFMLSRVKLTIGDPIDLSEYYGQERDSEVVNRLALMCVKEIAKLAGHDDFEPQIAGRGWKTWEKGEAEQPSDDKQEQQQD